MSNIPYGSFVNTDYQQIRRIYTPMLQYLFVIGSQHVLVVTYSVAHRVVGVLYIQHRPQRLVHHVNHIKSPGITVQIYIQFLVIAYLVPAVFMQQLVAVFQRAACQ